jgi:hypothetical protein
MATCYHRRKGERIRDCGRLTFALTADEMGPEFVTCCLCQQPAAGFWFCGVVVAVCQRCAVEKLPLLIADCVVGEVADADTFARLLAGLEAVQRAYWRGAGIAVERANRLTQEENARRRRVKGTSPVAALKPEPAAPARAGT